MILSGLRLFDIRNPYHPKEIAYFNGPIPKIDALGQPGSSASFSTPAFDIARGDIWYTDQISAFYVVHVTHGVWPF